MSALTEAYADMVDPTPPGYTYDIVSSHLLGDEHVGAQVRLEYENGYYPILLVKHIMVPYYDSDEGTAGDRIVTGLGYSQDGVPYPILKEFGRPTLLIIRRPK